MAEIRTIPSPRKSYWRSKRLDSHSNWKFARWRELFQNSIDAGATRIDISLSEEDGKGSWGREPNDERVIRTIFTDNGCGMTEDILENVFFNPGESTKRDINGSVGGFGTARTMTCFPESRYGIKTNGLIVEGDGSSYTIEESSNPIKGTEFELDTATVENGQRNTLYSMRDNLEDYLKYSQISSKVFVNGVESKTGTRRGKLARRLVADVNGSTVEFAGIHVNRSEKNEHKGMIIVRVHGTTMFIRQSYIDFGVVVEIDPSMTRTVLMDNRDGMKEPFERALSNFMAELNRDVKTALSKEDKRKHVIFRGGLGDLRQLAISKLKKADWNPDNNLIIDKMESVPKSSLRYISSEEFEVVGYGGADALPMTALIEKIKSEDETFISTWKNQDEALTFSNNVKSEGIDALGQVSEEFGRFLAAGVSLVNDENKKFVNMHDIHIYKEGITASDNKELYSAVTRWSPDYWRKPGEDTVVRGIVAHSMLSVWTTCCQHTVNYLSKIRPDIIPKDGLKFATGFAFVKDEPVYSSYERKMVDNRTIALYKNIEDTHVLMINPLLSNGEKAFDLNKEGGVPGEVQGIVDIAAAALHETAHIFRNPHDEEYATILTQLMKGFINQDFQKSLRQDIRTNLDAIRAAYGKGVSKIQALEITEDNVNKKERMPRPAQRLQALATPAVTLIAGTIALPENEKVSEQEMPALLVYLDSIVSKEENVTSVNCDSAQTLNDGIVNIFVPEPQPENKPDPLKSSSDMVNLSNLDISRKESKNITEPTIDTSKTSGEILSSLSQGRFSAPVKKQNAVLTQEQRIENAIKGKEPLGEMESLINSGRLNGLAQRISKLNINLQNAPVVNITQLVEDEFSMDDEDDSPTLAVGI